MESEEAAKAIVGRLHSTAVERVGKRIHIEERWYQDLRQFYGQYETETAQNLEKPFGGDRAAQTSRSKVFMNMTRPKTLTMAAKLFDLLFPTDDRNWTIEPTPIPELTRASKKVADMSSQKQIDAAAMAAQANEEPNSGNVQAENDQATREAMEAEKAMAELQASLDKAQDAADMMIGEVEDILSESGYAAEARAMIDDACKIGCGVLEGPVVDGHGSLRWKQDDTGQYVLTAQDKKPRIRRVDPWSFFPDMDVTNIEDGDGVYVRHMKNAKGLRAMAKSPGFNSEAIKRLLKAKPTQTAPNYVAELNEISGSRASATAAPAYQVWQFTGELTAADMAVMSEYTGDAEGAADAADKDPLESVSAVVWFCEDELLKIAPHPLDRGGATYSVFSIVNDESGPIGYGVPWMMRDEQAVLNASWRMLMDNSGIGAGPQIVVNKNKVQPVDGNWEITTNKLWEKTAEGDESPGARAFDVYNIDTHQAELANNIGLALKAIDDVTGLPTILSGDEGNNPVQTATGMTLLLGSANITFRRIVKNFDDGVTVPVATRCYDWIMQFSENELAKGDYNAVARGSSALLQRETDGQNLLMVANSLGAHPIYGLSFEHDELLREIFRAHMLPADRVLKTKQEIKVEQSQQSEDPAVAVARQTNEIKQAELQVRVEMANMEASTRIQAAQIEREIQIMKLSEARNIAMEKVVADLNKLALKSDMDIEKTLIEEEAADRRLAVEVEMTKRIGPSGGGVL